MDGQWGWLSGGGSSVFATAAGWFEKDPRGDYWCHDVVVPQVGAWGDHQPGWGNHPVQVEGSNWSTTLMHAGKCVGWESSPCPNPVNHSFNHWKPEVAAGSDEFSLLPDDLLEKIFAALPLLSLFRARAVCRRWHLITTSASFKALCAQVTSHKPWYLMYKDSEKLAGVAFDPTSRKWHNFVLPTLDDPSATFVASAGGLACFLDKTNSDVAYVCNPMTKAWKKLPKPPDRSSDYCAVAMCARGGEYMIVVARSTPVTNDYAQWSLSIEVYDSGLGTWKKPRLKLLQGWRPGEESNICNGIFYCVTHSTVGAGHDYSRHGLIAFDMINGVFRDVILPMPCSLSCVRLVNCREKLVMVGGIGTYDFIKGVGVWELEGEWKQVSRMPTKQFHGFAGGLDDVFSCSGHGDLIYIHSYGSPQLMVFDIPQSSWTWARACPVLKRDPLHLFTGFCFQPRLDVSV